MTRVPRHLLVRLAVVCAVLLSAATAWAQTGTVSGTIRNSSNVTVAGVTVQLVNTQNGQVSRFSSVTTAPAGTYSITGVSPGSYYIRTTNNVGLYDQIVTQNPPPAVSSGSQSTGRTTCVGCIVTSNNQVTSNGGGVAVTVTSGVTTTADFFLTPGLQITGSVSGGGSGLSGVSVTIFTSGGATVGSVNTVAGGGYTSMGLVPGNSYFVKASNATGFIDAVYKTPSVNCLNCAVTTTGTAVPAGTTAVNFTLNAGFTISGRVFQADGTTGIGGAQVTFYNSAGSNIGSTQTLNSGTVGNFTSGAFPNDTYYVATTSSNTTFVNQIYSNTPYTGSNPSTSLITAGTAVVISGLSKTDINFQLSLGGTASGTVKDTNAQNVGSGSVALYNASGSQVASTQINAGSYSFTGVKPGTYRIATSNTGFINQLYNNKPYQGFPQASFFAGGDTIDVQQSPTTTTNFVLAAAASISGTVSSGGSGVQGISVQLLDSNNSFVASQTTDAGGAFSFTGLIPNTNFFIKTQNAGGVGAGYVDKAYTSSPSGGVTCNSVCNATQIENAGIVAAVGANTGKNISLIVGARISGTVTQLGGANGPLQGVQVQAYDPATPNQAIGSATTDASGVYTVGGLSSGAYAVKTTNSLGYLDKLYNNIPCMSCSASAGNTVSVTTGGTGDATGINFALVQGGTIKGTVTNAAGGAGIGNMAVQFYNSAGAYVGFSNTSNQPGSLGEYTSPGLPDGNYFAATNGFNTGFIYQLYSGIACLGCTNPVNGVSGALNGTPIAVVTGNATTGKNFALNAGVSISGKITDRTTTLAIANVRVQIFTAASGTSSLTSTTTNTTGDFTLTGLPAGTYFLRTNGLSGGGTFNYIDQTFKTGVTGNGVNCSSACKPADFGTAIVLSADQTGKDFSLPAGGSISGTVTANNAGVQGVSMSVYDINNTSSPIAFATTAANGTYTLSGIPTGQYYVRASPTAASGLIGQVANGKTCLNCQVSTGDKIQVTAGSAATTVNFSLSSGGTITGTIRSAASGNPVISGVNVTLSTAASSFVTSTSTNANGVFTMAGLPADTYYLRTSNSLGYLDKLYDNVPCINCSNASANGTPIALLAGQSKTADFTLAPGARISGFVTDAGTGEPISGIQVSIYNSAGNFLASGFSNDAGAWVTAAGLAPGNYFAKTSQGSSSGLYINKLYNNITCTSCLVTTGAPIAIVGTNAVPNINFALTPGGRVTGFVTDGTTPVAGVGVNIYTAAKDPQTNQNVFLGSGFTGANGAYAVNGLPAGQVVAKTSNSLGYIDKVFNDVTCLNCNVSIGQAITVTNGETTPNINFGLVPGARITGTIVSAAPGNPPIPNVSVGVFNNANVQVGTANTNSIGVYTTGGLLPGTYYVKTTGASGFVNQLYSGLPCASCSATSGTKIELSGTAAATANFTLSAGATISGTVVEGAASAAAGDVVTNAVGGPLSGIGIQLYDSGNAFVTSTSTDTTGNFTLRGIPAGTYFVKTSNTQGFIDQMYDGVNCTFCSVTGGTGIPVTALENKGGVNFTLVRGGSISGAVTDTASTPLGSVTVVAFGASGQSLKSTQTNGLGQFVLAGLGPGTYYVRTSNSLGYIDKVYNDVICASCNVTTGAPIKLTSVAPNATGITFALPVGGQIAGTITQAGGAPIENVSVSVYSSTGALVGNGFTNALGAYKTSGLPAGSYYLKTNNSRGFIDQVYDGKPCSGCNPTTGNSVAVTLGQVTSNINFVLSAGGRISGAVTSNGVGVPNAAVIIFNALGQSVGNGITDGTGSYTTSSGLPTGTYYAKTSNNAGLVDEIYDDIRCASCPPMTGKPIPVVTGATTSGVSFALIAGSRIGGTVIDKTTTLPVANARVEIYTANGYYVTAANTGSNGGYITGGGLSAGTYYARAVAGQSYVPKLYNDIDCPACPPFKGTAIVVEANASVSGIDFALSAGGQIAGQITDAATAAAVGSTDQGKVSVTFYNVNNQAVGSAPVDESGRYQSAGLPAGVYYVRTFNSLGYINKIYNLSTPCLGDSGGGKAGSGSGGGGLAAPSCLPNTGTPVTVVAGQKTLDINIALSLGLRIGGTITDIATGLPIAGADVRIFDANGKGAMSGTTDNAGSYASLGGLPPGTYYAAAGAEGQGYYRKLYNDIACVGCNVTLGTPIVVQQSKGDVHFALAKGGSLSGSVKAASTNAPLANLKLSLYTSTGSLVGSGVTDGDGQFNATGVPPGSYFLRTFNLLGYVDQAWQNKVCAPCPIDAATPIVVAASATTVGLDFSLANGGLVRGYITDQTTGAPLQGVTVAFYLTDNTTFVGRSQPTDENGYYAISLPVGTYIARPDPVQGYAPVATSSPQPNGMGNGQISTVSVTAGGESEVVVTMDACVAPTVTPVSLANLSLGVPFSITLTASGAGGPYTFSVADGALPPGLTLNASTGVISGTPTTRGTANFTIGATGSSNCSGTTTYAQVTRGVTLNTREASVSSGAGGGTLSLTAEASSVKWTATSDSSWLTVGAASGTGSGTLSYTVAANTGAARTGAITVSGETFTVFQARSNRPRIALDAPVNGQVLSRSFTVAGWAVDLDASDVGVDAVHVYAYPISHGALGAGLFLGQASGWSRPDVATAFGEQFTNSGFVLPVTNLAVGTYRIVVFARTTLTGLFEAQQAADVTVAAAGANPAMALDGPSMNATVGASFVVGGWAIDRGASSGPGIDAVHVYAYPITAGGLGAAVFLGAADMGGERGDVGAVFGSAFTNSGFHLRASGLSAGRYRIVASARSTVTGRFDQSAYTDITSDVPVPNPAMAIDGPANDASLTQPFVLGGWAVDRGARTGAGVDALHVWAFNVATGDARFVGAASHGGTRADVGAVYGSQFNASGYSITVNDLPAGTYDIGVYLHSGVSGTFNLVKFVRVTVQQGQ